MMRSTAALIICILLTAIVPAQNLKTLSINEVKISGNNGSFYPVFSPDGSGIFYTGESFKGICFVDLNSGAQKTITEDQGAGYGFKVGAEGKYVYYRSDRYINGRKFSSLFENKLSKGISVEIVKNKRDLSVPLAEINGSLVYSLMKQVRTFTNPGQSSRNSIQTIKPFAYIDNCTINLYDNGNVKNLEPLGQGNYIWPSVSPDGTKLLFTVAGKGTYVSDLNGKILAELGYANYPSWSPDGKWIAYMVDKDDGMSVTSSDIYAASADGKTKVKLTSTDKIHEMYPSWGPDGKSIVCNSYDGRIFILKLAEGE